MKVNQIYEILNTIQGEILGRTGLVNEDLSNIVDLGTEIFNANAKDNFVKALVDKVGKQVFVNRLYSGRAPQVMMDSWEFGSVLEKVDCDLPDSVENESWDLIDGASYDVNVFYKPKVRAKYFNSKSTFEVHVSITEIQLKEAFNSAASMNTFIEMIYTKIYNRFTLDTDKLIMRLINTMSCQTVNNDLVYDSGLTTQTGVKAVNLLKEYKDLTGTTLTIDKALYDEAFLKYASFKIANTLSKMTNYSTLFNVGKTEKFTPKEFQKVVILDEFDKACNSYLKSTTYHNDLVSLGENYSTVSYWQGTGTSYALSDCGKVDCTIKVDDTTTKQITIPVVLGVAFDKDAVAVCNQNRRTTSNYVAKSEFYNEYHKMDAHYIADLNENFVVFFMA